MNKPQSIQVIARRWFHRTYGNTYFSVKIYVDGELVHTYPFEYGYGDYYLQYAGNWLKNAGYTAQEYYAFGGIQALPAYCRENGITLEYHVQDVQRKKDL